MRVTKLTDYGLLIMSALALNPSSLHSATQLAEQLHLPFYTVSKLLKQLAQKNLIHAKRGKLGGYSLSVPLHQISLGQMIDALEGHPFALTECVSEQGTCRLTQTCAIQKNWSFINNYIRKILNQYSLDVFLQNEISK